MPLRNRYTSEPNKFGAGNEKLPQNYFNLGTENQSSHENTKTFVFGGIAGQFPAHGHPCPDQSH
jgi:hypothetical protein